MGETHISRYRSDVAEARMAFGEDPNYAIAIARQAGTLLSRAKSKQERAEGSQPPV